MILYKLRRWFAHRRRKIDEDILFDEFRKQAKKIGKPELGELFIEIHKKTDRAWHPKWD